MWQFFCEISLFFLKGKGQVQNLCHSLISTASYWRKEWILFFFFSFNKFFIDYTNTLCELCKHASHLVSPEKQQQITLFPKSYFSLWISSFFIFYTYLRTYYKNTKSSAYLSTIYGHFNPNAQLAILTSINLPSECVFQLTSN